MNIAQNLCAGQGVDSIVDKHVSNVGYHTGTVITTTGYSSTSCSPPHVGLVNSSVSGMSIYTTVEGVTVPIPHASLRGPQHEEKVYKILNLYGFTQDSGTC